MSSIIYLYYNMYYLFYFYIFFSLSHLILFLFNSILFFLHVLSQCSPWSSLFSFSVVFLPPFCYCCFLLFSCFLSDIVFCQLNALGKHLELQQILFEWLIWELRLLVYNHLSSVIILTQVSLPNDLSYNKGGYSFAGDKNLSRILNCVTIVTYYYWRRCNLFIFEPFINVIPCLDQVDDDKLFMQYLSDWMPFFRTPT